MHPIHEGSKVDGYPTSTSDEQIAVELLLSQFRPKPSKAEAPQLDRNAHVNFLVRILLQGLPTRYVSQDASQPWILFWVLQSISILGVGLDPDNKQKIIDTVMCLQHPEGGFGGGPYQFPHLLTTYASVCTLAIVGRPGPGGGWDQIDREKLYELYMSLKQPDGSFLVARDMEVDIRGTYCLLVVSTLLDILTPELTRNTASFISSLQTYEGGFASASSSLASQIGTPASPLGESHGGYTSCALASWLLLRQAGYLSNNDLALLSNPPPGVEGAHFEPYVDLGSLTRWLIHLQEPVFGLGGFRGRTNKLVDGCYSWWVGGCFDLLAALGVPTNMIVPDGDEADTGKEAESGGDEADWEDSEDVIYDAAGLQSYILRVAQSESGGLRDKPKKPADAYHTLYNLAGLSSAQHHMRPSAPLRANLLEAYRAPTTPVSGASFHSKQNEEEERRKEIWASSLSWVENGDGKPTGYEARFVGGKSSRANASHPLFNLTTTHVKGIMNHFYGQA